MYWHQKIYVSIWSWFRVTSKQGLGCHSAIFILMALTLRDRWLIIRSTFLLLHHPRGWRFSHYQQRKHQLVKHLPHLSSVPCILNLSRPQYLQPNCPKNADISTLPMLCRWQLQKKKPAGYEPTSLRTYLFHSLRSQHEWMFLLHADAIFYSDT